MSVVTEEGIGTLGVSAVTGASLRQLNYWDNTSLVRPSVRRTVGKGTPRLYSMDDVMLVAVLKRLLDHGVNLSALRIVVESLRRVLDRDAEALWLVLGDPVEVVTSLHGVARRQRGLYAVLDLAHVAGEVAIATEAYQKTRQFGHEPVE